jgi:hypothetical protein
MVGGAPPGIRTQNLRIKRPPRSVLPVPASALICGSVRMVIPGGGIAYLCVARCCAVGYAVAAEGFFDAIGGIRAAVRSHRMEVGPRSAPAADSASTKPCSRSGHSAPKASTSCERTQAPPNLVEALHPVRWWSRCQDRSSARRSWGASDPASSAPGDELSRSRVLARHGMVGPMGQVASAGDITAIESFFALLQKNIPVDPPAAPPAPHIRCHLPARQSQPVSGTTGNSAASSTSTSSTTTPPAPQSARPTAPRPTATMPSFRPGAPITAHRRSGRLIHEYRQAA